MTGILGVTGKVVDLLSWDHEINGSSLGNNLWRKYKVRLCIMIGRPSSDLTHSGNFCISDNHFLWVWIMIFTQWFDLFFTSSKINFFCTVHFALPVNKSPNDLEIIGTIFKIDLHTVYDMISLNFLKKIL